ncbi:MAG: type II toxin-antitoxin system VapC family toxin [Verrucomicrobiales bacterium]|jgi:predicted nucleic acid-binding protein|nr:type II toxin-antitoxin system VapC family toxin [Verrucomicrobiales bacterium]
MMFCDTSFGARLYVPEQDSDTIRQIIEQHDAVSVSALFQVEVLSVFHRLWRENWWSQATFQASARQFQRDLAGGLWQLYPLTAGIIAEAVRRYETLPKTIFLRAADCLHLATALQHGFDEIHTFDRHQANAARAFGLRAVTAGDELH